MQPNIVNNNRPMNQQPMNQQPMNSGIPQQNMSAPANQYHARPSKTPWVILALVVLLAAAALAFVFRDKLSMNDDSKVSGYKAVFLTNGQVYFGKMSKPNGQYVTLRDIYYLQVNQPLQSGDEAAKAAAAQQQPELSLVKLGNELHGPVDEMQINRDQILFYEDLKTDGKVAEAIEAYKKNPTGSGTQTQTPVPQQQQQQPAPQQ